MPNSLSSPTVQLKDYYTILEIPPSATLDEVKKAYRRLAQLYHPDKNNNDVYASAQFAEVKEAYETLSNATLKDQYLQQRWYARSLGRKTTQGPITPEYVLKQLLELDKYVRLLDVHRMDQEGLHHYLEDFLSEDTIEKVNSFKQPALNKEIVLIALNTTHPLSYSLISKITQRLKKLEVNDERVHDKIDRFVQARKTSDYWEKRKIWLILIFVAIICGIICIAA
ncbi:J domain-containing protein [Terrimonas sp. NA20]|uniref:J domain-containing protein n=1 Tax=Terrimonas ginsenosidimutans TaxID=2908004 RepID=A0ABS9KXX2_9BACT|nr:J domain-containing protein [Terrimonas ginsenosidimutans]MCG2617202.1 J domain-containing protein [Terrimonas ginsenosidimutans]